MRLRAYNLLLCLALAGCGNLFEPAAAVVNGEKITITEVDRALERLEATPEFKNIGSAEEADALRRQFEQGYLAALIRRAVLRPEARRLGISVSDEEIQERIDEIKAQYPTEEDFENALREQGVTEPLLREFILDRELEEKLRDHVGSTATVSEDEIRAYYEEHRDDYELVRVQHILVEEEALAQRLADQLRQASDRQADPLFESLARRYSQDDSTAERAGRLGDASGFGKSFENATAKLRVGAISDPIRTRAGYHVARLMERRVRTLAEVRDEIERQLSVPLQDEAWEQWVVEAYESAGVKVNPRYGVFEVDRQLIRDPTAEDLPGVEVPTTTTPTAGP